LPRPGSLASYSAARRRPAALIFTYGTLMRGYGLHQVLAGGATFLGAGSVCGRLVDLGRFPGLIEGRGRVRGEIYRLDDPELLTILDREEGYNFERRRATVTSTRGRRVRAWVYRYRGSRHRAVLIPDGDYRRARRETRRGDAGSRQRVILDGNRS
jgi:gamma-glutamylcyclotransferase (GGCT)/AIG2-like uncharacterized protein YtfP